MSYRCFQIDLAYVLLIQAGYNMRDTGNIHVWICTWSFLCFFSNILGNSMYDLQIEVHIKPHDTFCTVNLTVIQ